MYRVVDENLSQHNVGINNLRLKLSGFNQIINAKIMSRTVSVKIHTCKHCFRSLISDELIG